MTLPRLTCVVAVAILASGLGAAPSVAQSKASAAPKPDAELFRRDNLIAWCIVPFDAKKRGPEERAAMLERLGFKHFAYDYRAEHVPTFDAEIAACKKHGVSLDAWWFPTSLNGEARLILDVCRRNDIRPQLWVTGGGSPTSSPVEQRRRVEQEAARIRPIAEAAAAQGMKVALYNHGGWFGEPENQIAIIEHLKLPNVGIVYNLHHGHDHLKRFPELLGKMLPHLLALNLNGMAPEGDRRGQKILQLGQGPLDLELLRAIRASGYRGPIGILGHTQDDAEARLADNLDGLDWLLPQLDGKSAAPRPKPRTPVPQSTTPIDQSAAAPASAGWLIDGRNEYRTAPLSVACRVTLTSSASYNILVASDTKQSGAHWELFSMPGNGFLTAYLPGYEPDHVRSEAAIVDGHSHDIAMTFEPNRVRLYRDGKLVADQAVRSRQQPGVPGGLAIGRLVEGGIGSTGSIASVQFWRGARSFESPEAARPFQVDDATIGLWRFDNRDNAKKAEAPDESPLKNPARRSELGPAPAPGRAALPSAGPHLKPTDVRLKTVLIDRSPSDVYMGVKVDDRGAVFVGGREAVFVFEPKPGGGYASRHELLRFPPDSIIMGLEFRGDDLYVLTANALYLVPEGRVRRTDVKPQRILWGLPLDLHVSFHCLAWGPDGDLYVTHGDPLLNYGDWSRPDHWGHWILYCGRDNKAFPYTGQGAVLRMKPDGTDVRVVARGLRGPVGLAFDSGGNLFTNDNDHESRADQYAPSRLLHVVDGVDFAWPRGWMASKSPDRYDLVEPMVDLGRGVPCDMIFYDRPLLAEQFGERLLMCRWDRHAVTAYRLSPRGVSFSTTEETIAVGDENCRPVGIATDRHGRLFVTSLYMTGNMAAPDCASDLVMIDRADGTGNRSEKAARVNSRIAPRSATPATTAVDPLADARSDDTYRRQLGATALAQGSTAAQLQKLAGAEDEPTRLAAILAIGRKLTVPEPDFVPPSTLALFYPEGNPFFHRQQHFYGEKEAVDLATLGRIGSFTIAQWWAAAERSPDQSVLFETLVQGLSDSSDRVRLQSAYFLSLLKDSRSESLVERTRREVQLSRLGAAREYRIGKAWTVGLFDDGKSGQPLPQHGPEKGPIDLSANYGGLTWAERSLVDGSSEPGSSAPASGSMYYYFSVQSSARQSALLTLESGGASQLWLNETLATDVIVQKDPPRSSWIVDLQPGSNGLLLRTTTTDVANRFVHVGLALRAPMPLELTLPEKLDSALLAERLRSAATAGASQAVPSEFATVDWNKTGASGNAAEGRRLFGALGCAKCHAVAAEQKSAGAPSLFEAKRRFTTPHLVESVLLPSRQVAELFRAQNFVMEDGRTVSGLVTSESADVVELLLPDATRATLAKRQIEERSATLLSPMPQGLVKTPDELRHLLAYLLSERPLPP